eukprot:gene5107-7118_t
MEELFLLKKDKNLSFSSIGSIIGRDEVWIASLFHGQATADEAEAAALQTLLGFSDNAKQYLMQYPTKGCLPNGQLVPTDPLIYRFYEIIQVYGMPLKDVIQEKFGDGIMSAIDFTMKVDKEEDPKGDRVVVTMNGKFLPYKKW